MHGANATVSLTVNRNFKGQLTIQEQPVNVLTVKGGYGTELKSQ
jgi:hypothetical protein